MRMPGIWELKHWTDFVEVTAFSAGHVPRAAGLLAAGLGPPAPARRATSTWSTTTSASATACSAIERDGPPGARPRSTTRSPSTAASRWSTPQTAYKRDHAAPLVRVHQDADPGGQARCSGSSRCRRQLASRHPRATTACRSSACTIVPVGVDPDLFRPLPGVERDPRPAHHHRRRRRHDEGPALTCSRRWPSCAPSATSSLVVIGKPKEGGRSAETIERLGPDDVRRVRDRRARRAHHRAVLRGRAGRRAVALRGLLAAGHRGHVVRRARSSPPPAGRCPRWSAPTTRPRCSCRPATARRWPPSIAHGPRRPRAARPRRRRRPPAGHRPLELAPHRRDAPSSSTGPCWRRAAAGAR